MADISPHVGTLDRRLAKHLARRATFVFNDSFVTSLEGMTVDSAVNLLTNGPFNDAAPEPRYKDGNTWVNLSGYANYAPDDGNTSEKNERIGYIMSWFLYNSMKDQTIHSKLTFLLHNQFTTNPLGKESFYFYDYLSLLKNYAKGGSLRELAQKMTLDNLMLQYLNNTQNNKNSPNENYARELLELFTIGKGDQVGQGDYTNYTEADIVQAARVLTGFQYDKNKTGNTDSDTGIRAGLPVYSKHDTGDKTFSARFSGQTITGAVDENDMNRELKDLIDMIYDQRATAEFLARRIYRYFVSDRIGDDIESDIITPLANNLESNNYDVLIATKLLLKSKHFYDLDDSTNTDEIIGALMKSPSQLATEMVTAFDVEQNFPDPDIGTNAEDVYGNNILVMFGNLFNEVGMFPFAPDSVAGYPAYYQEPLFSYNWFNTATMLGRYEMAKNMSFAWSVPALGTISIDILDFMENNSGIFTDLTNSTTITQNLLDYLLPEGGSPERVTYIKDLLEDIQGGYTWSEVWTYYQGGVFGITADDVRAHLSLTLEKVLSLPEFQSF